LLLAVRSSWGVFGAVFAYTAASMIVLLLGIFMWRRATPQTQTVRGNFSGRLLASTSFPLLLVASMDLIMAFTDTIVLGIFGRSAEVGVYGAAMRTAMLTSFVLIAVNSVAAPRFAALFHQGELRTLESVARNATRLMVAVAAPALLLLILAPGLALRAFGEGFGTGAVALAILAVGQFVNVATGPVSYLLTMSGNQIALRNNNVCAALLNLGLNLLLVPRYGMNGAAIATAGSWITLNVMAMLLVRRRLGIAIWGVRR